MNYREFLANERRIDNGQYGLKLSEIFEEIEEIEEILDAGYGNADVFERLDFLKREVSKRGYGPRSKEFITH